MQSRVFLSYRSLNSDYVRIVADWLTHNGIDIWFAEERIPLDMQFHEPSIKALIKDGLGQCDYALLFTNEPYIGSEWCMLEAQEAWNRFGATPSCIIEVCLPEEAVVRQQVKWLQMSNIKQLVLTPECPPDLEAIHRTMLACGWSVPHSMLGAESIDDEGDFEFPLPILGGAFDMTGWTHEDQHHATGMGSMVQYVGLDDVFVHEINGPIRMCISSTRYPREANPWPSNASDRYIRQAMCDQAQNFRREFENIVGDAELEVERVHLLIIGQRGHFAITYSYNFGSYGRCAGRKYSLIFSDPVTGFPYEVTVTVTVYGGLKRLNALSPWFDYVVRSLHLCREALDSFLLVSPSFRVPSELARAASIDAGQLTGDVAAQLAQEIPSMPVVGAAHRVRLRNVEPWAKPSVVNRLQKTLREWLSKLIGFTH